MLIHYIKIAFRNLAIQKIPAFINIVGLSIGLACFSLFLLYAVNEFSFDRFHKNAGSIYRVYEWSEGIPGADTRGDAGMYMPLGPAMKQDLPDVKNFVRYQGSWDQKFVKTNTTSGRLPLAFADPQLFTVFSFKLLFGDPVNALKDLRNVVVTRDRALQLFGETNVIGKILEIKVDKDFEQFTISAVVDNIQPNSSIQFDILLSFDYLQTTSFGKDAVNNWHYSGFQTYVQLNDKSSLANDAGRLAQFRKKYFPGEEEEFKKMGIWNGKGMFPVSFRLQQLQDIHTNLKITAAGSAVMDPKYIWILLSIAAGILLIACINFTTLAIGRSAGRAKEIGVRKVIGSGRKQLILQFFTESLLLSILSAILGLIIAQLLLPYFNQLSENKLTFSFSRYPELIWFSVMLILLVSILAGSYPAFVLSGFKPVEVLKNKIRLGGSNIFTRSLVTVQFVLSIGLIISTVIILQQLNYMRSKYPGFNKGNVVVIDATGIDAKKIYPLFKHALSAQSQVTGITSSDIGLGEEGYNSSGFEYNGKSIQIFRYSTGSDYIKVMGMKLLSGRNFDRLIISDSINSVIVNEAFVKDIGLSNEKILGLKLKGYSAREDHTPVVIGVVKNFNFLPLSQEVKALLFRQPSDLQPLKFFVRIKPGNPAPALDVIRKAWSNIVPDISLQYSFLDEKLGNFYKSEVRWSNIVGWAGAISIFLACLGLFGLAALSSLNRTKEIGIRKVLGASVSVIIQLLSKDFLKLVIIALLIATPLSWYLMNKWLQDYAYKINIQLWVFVITGMVALFIAFLTISFQAIKAAMANPAKSLRTE
ncbi:MAG: ABC transporter permease [Ferruginibacter sp.]